VSFGDLTVTLEGRCRAGFGDGVGACLALRRLPMAGESASFLFSFFVKKHQGRTTAAQQKSRGLLSAARLRLVFYLSNGQRQRSRPGR
jgi:hypothetical protein